MKHCKFWAPLAFLLLGWSCQSWAVPDLGTIVGDATYAGILDNGDQTFGISDLDGVDDDITGVLVLELAGFAASNESFMYDLADPTNRLPIFTGPDAPLDSVVLTYDIGTNTWDNGVISVMFASMAEFGLGLTNGVGTDFFSQDILNAGGARQVGVFDTEGAGGLLGAFQKVFAWEDLPLAMSDGDYNDHVFAGTDIIEIQQVVTTPAPLLLVGFGLLAIAGCHRRVFG